MTAATQVPVAAAPPMKPGYRRRPITRDEFYQMLDLGFFRHQRVRLIGGEIIEMAAQGNLHGLAVGYTCKALEDAFGVQFWVRNQLSLDLSPLSVPDPDAAVVPGSMRSYHGRKDNPTGALLIVEVSDATLYEDRNWMASLYAASGIADYWIVNIPGKCVEVRRDPQPDPDAAFGHSYSSLATLRPGEFVTPLAVPVARVAVADLLPA